MGNTFLYELYKSDIFLLSKGITNTGPHFRKFKNQTSIYPTFLNQESSDTAPVSYRYTV